MKVNFGCGDKKLKGYLNVDIDGNVRPDKIVDINKLPWPFEESSIEYAVFDNVVEHLHVTLLDFVEELTRVLKPNGRVLVICPNAFFWKNRIAFLKGNFKHEHGFAVNHSFLLKPSHLYLYFYWSGYSIEWLSIDSVWERFICVSRDLFSPVIKMVGRKKP